MTTLRWENRPIETHAQQEPPKVVVLDTAVYRRLAEREPLPDDDDLPEVIELGTD